MKLRTFTLALSACLFLLGCSDKPAEQKKEEASAKIEQPAVAGKIEVEENKDAFKAKVEEKENNDSDKERAYYYSYNKEKASNDKTYTKIDANMRVRSPYERVEISLLVSKLSKEFIIKCSACHNDYANGIIGPSLLNKDKAFIFNSIMDFKTGKKNNVLMTELVKQMSEEQIDKLASEIAEFNKKISQLKKGK